MSNSFSPKSDGADESPSLSHYSSCGESELERYCSANSALGTPSICGSSVIESELGFTIRNLEKFVLDKTKVSNWANDDDADDDDDVDDDSMYACGSDEENRKNVYVSSNDVVREHKNENPLVINSSVAFGNDDWDDFELAIGSGGVGDFEFDGFLNRKDRNFDAQIMHFDSAAVGSSIRGGEVMDDGVTLHSCNVQSNQIREMKDISVDSNHESTKGNSCMELEQDEVEGICFNPLEDFHDRNEPSSSVNEAFDFDQDSSLGKTSIVLGVNASNSTSVKSEGSVGTNNQKVLQNEEVETLEVEVDPLSERSNELSSELHLYSEVGPVLFEDGKPNSVPSMDEHSTSKTSENNHALVNRLDNVTTLKADNHQLTERYDEIVNEMEEILLDSVESPGSRFPQGNRTFQSTLSLPQRDDGSAASTSGTAESFLQTTQPLRIDGIEVVGAKQKKGDVSFSERLVGVKEYTVYIIKVWSGSDQWEVERRYRDFFTLYRRLKSLFADQGWTLPAPWSTVEKESRKIFGNVSPYVVSERSNLIQECLRSVLHSGLFSTPPSALIWFLCPEEAHHSSPVSKTSAPWFSFSNVADTENISTLGKTISLIVEIRPQKSVKQILDAQHYKCAGCHRHFDDGMTLMRDFVQTLGWGKPRLCEYTGQLFCSTCHANDTAVLPARVLHYWDFNLYPVSQLAKSYLDSIHEQPMLCVSAVNPFLFSKVPALHHVMNIRKKIGTMLQYIRCPFRRTIQKGLGSRRYLLESNDFFALKDLVDLSKGPFSALPVMVETVSRKILEHITEQCLLCCDVGVPCCARQACNDPSSLIFPFQESEVERCASCESVFHKPCFRKLANCSCGADLGASNAIGPVNSLSRKASEYLLGKQSSSVLPGSLLSGLFSRTDPVKSKDHKDKDTVILMGSLPSTSL